MSTPFLTWEWFSALSEEPTLSRHSVVLVARDRDGAELGLLPVEIVRTAGGLRTVRCTGSAELGADHIDVVAVPEHRDAVAAAIARHITRDLRWDLADFEGLLHDGALARALRRELGRPWCLPRRPCVEAVPVVGLRGHSAEQVRQRLHRRSIRGLKSVQRAGGGYSVVEDPELVGPLLESLMDMHNDRFGEQSAVFASPELRRFHVTAATRMAAAGTARVCRLSTAEGDVALEYVLLLGDRAYSYQSGFRPDGGHSPGRTVMCRSILTAAEEGRTEYDLLRGDEAYKEEYTTGTRLDVRLRALRPTPRTVVWLAGRLRHRAVVVLQRQMSRSRGRR
ncbi:GNAT family N-acetyltransferase [Geodermatophilus sp. SYSU D00965]